MTAWSADQIPDQAGRRVVVTGASAGLGEVTARELARRGAQVVLAVRDPGRGSAAADRIRAAVPAARLEVRRLDLASLASVRAFASGLLDQARPLDLLINNAGVMQTPKARTPDGYELQFGTNHLGHFALTGLLLDSLAADGRVVTVSSLEHRPGAIHFDDLQLDRGYRPRRAYQQSKLANALFGFELDRRLRAAGSTVRSVLAHPGWSATGLQSTGPTGLAALALRLGNVVLAQSADRGALPQLFAATAPTARSGAFYGPGGVLQLRGEPVEVRAAAKARDVPTAVRLWALSEELTGISFPLPLPAG